MFRFGYSLSVQYFALALPATLRNNANELQTNRVLSTFFTNKSGHESQLRLLILVQKRLEQHVAGEQWCAPIRGFIFT